MMIRSIISIRVLFADLLFRFRDRNIFDESRRLVRGRGGGTLRASHYDQSVRHRTCDTGGWQALKWTSGVWRGLWPSRGDTRHRIRMLNQLASNNTSVDRDWDVDTAKGGSSVILSSHRVTIEAGTTQGVSLYTAYRVLESVPWAVSSDSGGPAWLETPAWPGLGPVWCRHQPRPHHHVNTVSSQKQWKLCNEWKGCFIKFSVHVLCHIAMYKVDT